MRVLLLVFLIAVASSAEAKQNETSQIDIEFVMERNKKDSNDIRKTIVNQNYGKKLTFFGTSSNYTNKTTIEILAKKTEGHRSMEIKVCIVKGNFFKLMKGAHNCSFFEKIEFQFQPNEVIIVPSKEEYDSRYIVTISERDVETEK